MCKFKKKNLKNSPLFPLPSVCLSVLCTLGILICSFIQLHTIHKPKKNIVYVTVNVVNSGNDDID